LNLLEFKYPINIIFIILPILCLLVIILGYKKKEKIMILLKINIRNKDKFLRTFLTILGLVFIVIALLAPQTLKGYAEIERKGLDIYFLIDTSKSMLVEDIKPNRISRAKKVIESIINNLQGDRIGFIPFSSSSYIQMPLTDDYQLARMFLDVMDTDMISGGGTNISEAIELAYHSFKRTSSADCVVIVLSDGEEHNSDSAAALKKINDEHIKVYTIGIGTEKGGLIPTYDDSDTKIIDYKKDADGKAIMSKLMPDTLKTFASSGNGTYYQSSLKGDEIELLQKEIAGLKRDTLKIEKMKKYKQLYQFFLGLGILLFIAGYLLPERRKAN
jgi:Ca-activated chloride channel family protein